MFFVRFIRTSYYYDFRVRGEYAGGCMYVEKEMNGNEIYKNKGRETSKS
jgi:hypothetical protein